MATKRSLDGSAPSAHPGGRPPAIKPEHIAVLHDIVTERAQASLQEIADELYRRCDVRVCDATIRRALRAQGFVRLKLVRRSTRQPRPRNPSAMDTRQPIAARTCHRTVPICRTRNGSWSLIYSSAPWDGVARLHTTSDTSS